MDYSLQIQKLLLKKDEAPLPLDKISFVKQAINLADAHNDKAWGFDLRMDLIDEESSTSRCIESFPAFAWVLDAYDQEPELYHINHLLSRYRLLIRDAYRNVSIEKQQIDNMLGDFQMRLIKENFSLRTFYTLSADFDYYVNDPDGIAGKLDRRNGEPVNHDFDYWLDELNDDIELMLMKGNFEKALHLSKQFTLNELEHYHYPIAIYSSFVLYLTKKGDLNRANEFFLLAQTCLESIGNDSSPISSISKLIRFLAAYDENKGWWYFERYLDWTIDSDDFTAYLFSMNVLPLLKSKKQQVTLQANPLFEWYRSDNTYNTADLYRHYYEQAITYAQKFDKRNSSKNFTKRLHEVCKPVGIFTKLRQKLFNLFNQ